jgi:hypothetical protein
MTVHRIFENKAFEPGDIAVLEAAYELCLQALGLSNRSDPLTDLIARKIIELHQRGERDPERLSGLVLEAIRS